MFEEEDTPKPKKRPRNRIPVALRGRGRRPRRGPKRKKRDSPWRLSPANRLGARFRTITVPEETYLMAKELGKFYKTSMGKFVESLVKPAFEKAYIESTRLKKIEENRQQGKQHEDETPDNTPTTRRTHF